MSKQKYESHTPKNRGRQFDTGNRLCGNGKESKVKCAEEASLG